MSIEPRHKKRNWYHRQINKPYTDGTDTVYITMYSPVIERNLPDIDNYAPLSLRTWAVDTILDYYGSSSDALGPDDLEVKNVYFPKRQLANPVVLLTAKTNESIASNPEYNRGVRTMAQLVDLRGSAPHWADVDIRFSQIPVFLKNLDTAFKIYDQQVKFFQGSITPAIQFAALYHRVKQFFQHLDAFINFNGLKKSNFTWMRLRLHKQDPRVVAVQLYKTNFLVPPKRVAYAQAEGAITLEDTNADSIILNKGTEFYFGAVAGPAGPLAPGRLRPEWKPPKGTNPYVIEILTHFDTLANRRRTQLNWTQFVDAFLSNAGIEVDYFGTPKTNTVANLASTQSQEGEAGPLGQTSAEKTIFSAFAKQPDVLNRAFLEARQKEMKSVEDTLNKRLEKATKDLQKVADSTAEFSKWLATWKIDVLLEAALECLLYRLGFQGAMPDFVPGIDPLLPSPPQIKIRFPAVNMKLPIISINKELQAQIEAGLKSAAMSALYGAMEAIAELIRDLCLTEDAETAPPSEPLPHIIDSWPNPTSIATTAQDCYEDFGLNIIEITSFLEALAPLITAREACDLFNRTASDEVLQIVTNLLKRPSYQSVHDTFVVDSEFNIGQLEVFFGCLGDLVDPAYCLGIYDSLVPELTSIDPCDIEDALGDAFDDLLDILNGIKDIAADMACGAGIVPSLSDIASYNHSVISLIDAVLSPVQQSFLTDLRAYKTQLIIPDPNEPANAELQEKLEQLQDAMNTGPFASGIPNDGPPGLGSMMENLIPAQVSSTYGEFGGLQQTLDNAIKNAQNQSLSTMTAALTWAVAPATQRLYETIEDYIVGSCPLFDQHGLPEYPLNANLQDLVRNWAFLVNIRANAANTGFGKTVVYNIEGSGNPGSPGDPQLANEEGTHVYGDTINIFNDVITAGDINATTGTAANALLGPASTPNQISARILEGESFLHAIASGPESVLDVLGSHGLSPSLPSAAIYTKKIYPFAYFSLINMFAYQIANSDLFSPRALENFSLFPKFCSDGQPGDIDLLDANQIKRESLQEFVDNGCSDQETELGPVRDAGILGLVNAYMQVLVVDFILKNIFIVSEFGINFFSGGEQETIVKELASQTITRRIHQGFIAIEVPGIPPIVGKGAALTVKKIIKREVQANGSFLLPISGEPANVWGYGSDEVNLITSLTAAWSADPPISMSPSIENSALQAVAVRYLFENRLLKAGPTINEYFKLLGNNTIETFLIHGIPHVELIDAADELPLMRPYDDDAEVEYGTITNGLPTDDPDYAIATWQKSSGMEDTRTPRNYFFFAHNYVNEGSKIWDNYVTRRGTDYTDESAEVIKANKEVDSFMTYGGLVLEKFFKIQVNLTKINELIATIQNSGNSTLQLAAGRLNEIAATLERQTPLEGLGFTTYQSAALDQSGVESTDEINTYYIGFDAFKRMFATIAQLADGRIQGFLPLPFSLRGTTPYKINSKIREYVGDADGATWRGSVAAANELCSPEATARGNNDTTFYAWFNDEMPGWRQRRQSMGMYLGINPANPDFDINDPIPWGSGDNGSNPYLMSDYTLIRNWTMDFQKRIVESGHLDTPRDSKKVSITCSGDLVFKSSWPVMQLRDLVDKKFGNFPYGENIVDQQAGITRQAWNPIRTGGDYGFADVAERQCTKVLAEARLRFLNYCSRRGKMLNANAEYLDPTTEVTSQRRTGLGHVVMWNAGAKWYNGQITPEGGTHNENWYTLFESQNYRVVARMEKVYPKAAAPESGIYHSSYFTDADPLVDCDEAGIYVYLEAKHDKNGIELGGGVGTTGATNVSNNNVYPFLSWAWSPGTIPGVTVSQAGWTGMRQAAVNMFDDYETEEELQTSLGNMLLAALREQDIDGPLIQDPGQPSGNAISDALQIIFPIVEMGTRLVSLSPAAATVDGTDATIRAYPNNGHSRTLVNLLNGVDSNIIKQYKSYFFYKFDGDMPTYLAHIATPYSTRIDVSDLLFGDKFTNHLETFPNASFSAFIDDTYDNHREQMAQNLASYAGVQRLFGNKQLLDVGRVLQFLYLIGEIQTLFGNFDSTEMFADTKEIIVLALQAAFAGDDYTATSNCDVSALQNSAMDGLTSQLGNLGTSFISTMLKETPKQILKGVVELTEPHVIVAKVIRDVSKQIFQSIESAEQFKAIAEGVGGISEAMAGLNPPGAPCWGPEVQDMSLAGDPNAVIPSIPLSLEDVLGLIREGIDEHYPSDFPASMKPIISVKDGIDLEGSIPYIFAIPPITPFGIIYLLLQLSQFPSSQVVVDPACTERSWPPS